LLEFLDFCWKEHPQGTLRQRTREAVMTRHCAMSRKETLNQNERGLKKGRRKATVPGKCRENTLTAAAGAETLLLIRFDSKSG
jgi:hypothetical protein